MTYLPDPPAIVFDVGTSTTRAGFATSPSPLAVLATAAVPLPRNPLTPWDDMERQAGDTALRACAGLRCEPAWALERGVVADWSAQEAVWSDCYSRCLKTDSSQHTVLLSAPPQGAPEAREAAAEILFETFDVPALAMADSALLALYSAWDAQGKAAENPLPVSSGSRRLTSMTGLVLDCGEARSCAVPVADGRVLAEGTRLSTLGGATLSARCASLLAAGRAGPPPLGLAAMARRVKESVCYVAARGQKQGLGEATVEGIDFCTGREFEIRVNEERHQVPEILFQHSCQAAAQHRAASLPEMVHRAIRDCPIDCRRELYANIHVSGGSTCFPGFDARLEQEVQALVDLSTSSAASRVAVCVRRAPNPRHAVWVGGAALARAPGALEALALSREAYWEQGAARLCAGAHAWA